MSTVKSAYVLIAHTVLSLSAIAAVTALAIIGDVSATTAVIVILSTTGLTASGNSVIQALIGAQTSVQVPKNGAPTVIRTGSQQ